ncbi:MAG TPA: hypothetical protein VIY48_21275 [Candidatus Paceibacterota bacterium]
MRITFTHSPRTILGYRKNGKPIYPIAGGSESAPEEVTESYSTPEPTDNPAWQPFLEILPDSLHETVRPVLQDWDRNVQSRYETIQQQYAPYEQFREQNIDPGELAYSYQVVQALNENPAEVIRTMAEFFGIELTPQQQAQAAAVATQPVVPSDTESLEVDPRIQQLEQGFQALAAMALQNQSAAEARQADIELEATLTSLKQQHGDFDENIVLSYMLSGQSPEQAVLAYKNLESQILAGANRPPAPRVMGGGGGVPNDRVNPATMSDAERRALVTNMLMNSNNT